MSAIEDALKADKGGDWDKAHNIVQDMPGQDAAWIHAYLHRKEGDDWNANYWYQRAGKPFFKGSLEQEFEELWDHFNMG